MDLSTILALLPAQYAGDATIIVSFVVSTCALIARFWPRPAAGSKWLPLYQIVNAIGMNGKHAANADDVGAGK
ncbi:hypothetical protein AA23498_1344 [Acetobacter nitrogenifigens DSM 23921 = NBRC 105050]|uniref:Uncharacterized protein n=2 Tax=Acetobacter TaxID=434 RepID=A0A511X5B6_9PROT|nr:MULTISPECIES: hypothetical protein [Acetobacter]MBO1361445.1 hypothetical protein [Acetobacter sacchari]GBQ92032.1 hypothetical protein AA23498_1344 [Acetobacter nitrogenifigens DSM 23921 = NBRC 105050]GEN58149.1 hypothetical protein ANI02nite_00330 [Acetobacter nitrogenifigens DSM 23921 = NBRC 105050]